MDEDHHDEGYGWMRPLRMHSSDNSYNTSSERVFSTAKNITDKKRWRLLPERLHKTIFFTPQSLLVEIAFFLNVIVE